MDNKALMAIAMANRLESLGAALEKAVLKKEASINYAKAKQIRDKNARTCGM